MDHDSLYHRLFSHPLLVEQARQLPTGHRLPSVLSVALQNGNRPWWAVQQVEDLIDCWYPWDRNGRAEGQAVILLRLLEHRFGPLGRCHPGGG